MLRSSLMSALPIGPYVACERIANVTAGKPALGGGITVPATAFVANLLLVGYVQSSGV